MRFPIPEPEMQTRWRRGRGRAAELQTRSIAAGYETMLLFHLVVCETKSFCLSIGWLGTMSTGNRLWHRGLFTAKVRLGYNQPEKQEV